MIPYPDISPVIVKVGPLQIRWYGMMYLIGFLAGYWLLRYLTGRRETRLKKEMILDLLTYAALGVVIGGRLGYALVYNFSYYLDHPIRVLFLWEGGLSFHGGFVGVVLAGLLFIHRRGLTFYEVADLVVIPLPIGLGLGRIGNFINGELYGRPTGVPWCMVFEEGGPCRHPSQLYESFLEGLVLFVCMWLIGRKVRPPGLAFWSFVALYGLLRFLVEFTRQPDAQLGFVLGPFSMGQLLSFPMFFLGSWMALRILYGARVWGSLDKKNK